MSTQLEVDLVSRYLHLTDGVAHPIEVSDTFWEDLASGRGDFRLEDGWLVLCSHNTQDWKHWEMHPAGDELVYLVSGAIDLIFETQDGERVVELRNRGGVLVRRGTWHTAKVYEPSDVLYITAGAGTQSRPAST